LIQLSGIKSSPPLKIIGGKSFEQSSLLQQSSS